MRGRSVIAVTAIAVLLVLPAMMAGEARARAGSGGSRGSRSFSRPVRPAPISPTPSTPARPAAPASAPASPLPSRPSPWSGLMGGFGGFLLGGLLGGLLFGGLRSGFGFGFLDLLFLGAVVLMVMSFLRSRRAVAPAYAAAEGTPGGPGASGDEAAEVAYAATTGATAATEVLEATADLERGLRHIRQMDPGFDPRAAEDAARDLFRVVQGALTLRDPGLAGERLEPEMRSTLQAQCDGLRARRRTNRTGQIDVQRASLTEAWQESGRDYVTVHVAGSMLDYVVDDGSGAVVDGSSTEPVEFEEYWTLTRPVGPNPWRLSAIQSG